MWIALFLASAPAAPLNLAYGTFELDNGLSVVLVPDAADPLVHLQLTFDVGSADEDQPQRGFTHLIEHLWFSGTDAVADPYEELRRNGATTNGSTTHDRIAFFTMMPPDVLPLALWLDADRMQHLSGHLTAAIVKQEVEVVTSEYDRAIADSDFRAFDSLHLALRGVRHPYAHGVIGAPADLARQASVQTVTAFLDQWFGPEHATLVLSGGFDPGTAEHLIRAAYQSVPSRHSTAKPHRGPTPPPKASSHRFPTESGERSVYLGWGSPAAFQPGDAELEIISSILGQGPGSRLHHALVETGMATEVYAYQTSEVLGSLYVIQAVAAEGTSNDALAALIDDAVWDMFNDHPPTDAEVERARAQLERARYDQMTTAIGRGRLLATYVDQVGRPDFLAEDIARISGPTPRQILERSWNTLSQPHVTVLFDRAQ